MRKINKIYYTRDTFTTTTRTWMHRSSFFFFPIHQLFVLQPSFFGFGRLEGCNCNCEEEEGDGSFCATVLQCSASLMYLEAFLHNLVETHEASEVSEPTRDPWPSLQTGVWKPQGGHQFRDASKIPTYQSDPRDRATCPSLPPSDGQELRYCLLYFHLFYPSGLF